MIGNITRGKSFQGASRYILGKERVQLLNSNIPGAITQSPTVIAREMERTARLNDNIGKPVYHISVSPADSETLSPKQWAHFGYRLLQEMGIDQHQFVIALHDDTTYPHSTTPRIHAHLLVNLVDSKGHFANPQWDYLKIQMALRTLEQEFELDSPFLNPSSSKALIQPDTKGQRQRYQRELDEYHNPNHPRSQLPQKSHRQQLQTIINDALDDCPNWTAFEQALKHNQVSIKRSTRGWSMDFKTSHFAGYQLGKQYTLPSILERIRVAQPTDRNTPETVAPPMVQSPSSGIGNVLAETGIDPDIIDAEAVQSTKKVQPKDIANTIATGTTYVAQFVEDQSDSHDKVVDGAFLAGQAGNVLSTGIKVGADFLPQRNGSDLTELSEQEQDTQTDGRHSADIIDGEVIVEPAPPQLGPAAHPPALHAESDIIDADVVTNHDLSEAPGQPLLNPHQHDEQLLAHNLSAFIEVRANAHQQPIDAPLQTRNGTVHLSGDRLTLTSNEPMVTTIEEHKHIGPDKTLETKQQWISGERPPQFEATRNPDGEWNISINSLTDDTKERIAQLPTTPEDYRDYQNASVVVDHIRRQANAADIPLHQLTEFEWTAQNNSFQHQFTLKPDERNGSIHITGTNIENQDMFDVTLRADNTLAVHQSNIDGQQIEQLKRLSQEMESPVQHSEPTHNQQLERTTSKGPQR
ncbi:MAG: relaxase/mobilization nuclease domain-containing protein [Cyanobacteria bacterium P01_F01_bin.150]